VLEVARKAGHTPVGTFDRVLGRVERRDASLVRVHGHRPDSTGGYNRTMKRRSLLVALFLLAIAARPRAADTLDIYFIDVEGGQSTLIVTPAGESMLVDAGFPSNGTFDSKPGDPSKARDPQRILAAARAAGITRINYLLLTHFHADHDGGVPELAQLLPIDTFVDHGNVLAAAETTSAGTLAAWRLYAAVRARGGNRLEPEAGETIPLRGVDLTIVSASGETIAEPLPGASGPNAACSGEAVPPGEPHENPRSTGFHLQFGRFRFLDIGDLSGEPLFDLVCPDDKVGPVDAYLVAHHGGADAAVPATFAAFKPRVAIVNNGRNKGGHQTLLDLARRARGVEHVWQLHRAESAGAANAPDAFIANLDERTAHWILLRASQDGSFQITNPRTGATTSYPAR
jgi:competence protein ComEC